MNILKVKFLEIENLKLAVLDGDYFTIVLEKEKSYDSFLCIKNHCYILQNYNQHIVLSVFKTS